MSDATTERRAEDLSATAVRVQEFMTQGGQIVRTRAEMPPADERVRMARVLMEECIETICKGLGLTVELPEENDFDPVFTEHGTGPDFEQLIDGIADTMFVLQTMFASCGVADVPVMREVCRSNLTKFREGWGRREDGKITKSPLYEPARYAVVEAYKELESADQATTA